MRACPRRDLLMNLDLHETKALRYSRCQFKNLETDFHHEDESISSKES